MRSKTIKKAIATVAAAAMVITSIVPAAPAQAAVKARAQLQVMVQSSLR